MTPMEPTADLRADPVALAHAAGELLDVAARLGELVRPALVALDLDEAAYGWPTLAAAHQATVSDLGATLGRYLAGIEGDADRLYQVAFTVQAADARAASRTERIGPAP
jgi:hypothetical protein